MFSKEYQHNKERKAIYEYEENCSNLTGSGADIWNECTGICNFIIVSRHYHALFYHILITNYRWVHAKLLC